MATIRNESGSPITLSDGHVLSPGDAPYNVDTTLPLEASLIASHKVIVVDGTLTPPVPANPFAESQRRTFVAPSQPVGLQPGDLWLKTDPSSGVVFDVLEVTQ